MGRYLTASLLESDPDAAVLGVGRSPCADGFFCYKLRETDPQLALLPQTITNRIDERFTYQRVDVLDSARFSDILGQFRPSIVFHLASALRHASGDQLRTNTLGASSLFCAFSLTGLTPKVVLSSTGGVYGAVPDALIPIHESVLCQPLDSYAQSKLEAEQIALRVSNERGLCTVIARVFNICGPGQNDQHVCGAIASQIHSRASSLRVRTLQTSRDFIDVRDVARALRFLGLYGQCGNVYNVASGIETRIASVVDHLLSLAAYNGPIAVNDLPASPLPNVARHVADPSRLRALGFYCDYDLLHSLRDLLEYYGHSVEAGAAYE